MFTDKNFYLCNPIKHRTLKNPFTLPMTFVLPLIKKLFGIDGIVLFPFIFLSSVECKNNLKLMNHEKIHFRQAIELGILPFYLFYGIEFFIRRVQANSKYSAYRLISFEREAYSNDSNPNYLKNKKIWSFLSYIKNEPTPIF